MTSIPSIDDFNSVSEGCFLVLPPSGQANAIKSNKRKRNNQSKLSTQVKRRSSVDTPSIHHDGFQQLFSGMESKDCMLLRKDAYHHLWERTNTIMEDTLRDLNHNVRNQIRHFVDASDDINNSILIPLPYREIPTALVFAGINTPDHNSQFSEIANTLRQPSPSAGINKPQHHHVALLSSHTCNSMKNIMSTMIEQFMDHDDSVLTSNNANRKRKLNDKHHTEDNDDNEDQTAINRQETMDQQEQESSAYQLGGTFIKTKPTKLLSHDLQLLVGWYMETLQQHRDNKKLWPKLVVVLQDFESFDPILLQDFMTVISEYRTQLPFVFVIGIATSTEILHQSLTKSTICLLRIEKFWLQQSDVWFNRVLDKIFINSNFTLKFGARPYKFLLDHFYLYDFSISKVKASMKYALMHHFYSNPLSIFLSLMGQSHRSIVTTLTLWHNNNITTADHAAHLRMLRSFRLYIEHLIDDSSTKDDDTAQLEQQKQQQQQNRQHALLLLDDDTYLMTEQVAKWLVDLGNYQRHFKRGMALVQFLQSQFPAFTGLGRKTRRVLYLEQLENTQWHKQADTLHWLVNLVRKMEATALGPFLQQLKLVLEQEGHGQDDDDDDKKWMHQILVWQEQLDSLAQADKDELAKIKRREKKLEGMMSLPSAPSDNLSGKDHTTTMHTATTKRHTKTAEKVQENAIEQLRQKGTVTSKMAMEIADWFHSIFSHDLRSYTTMPLYELVYYTHVKLHEKSFAPQPRGSIQTALSQSQYYINCDCCQQDHQDQQLLPSEQDTSLLYKLYLECGRMINLYDWFVAFGCLIERESRPTGHPLEENEIQARFIRSVAELQFLGFIKPTQRRTDHVIRLTWSNI
ncbi:origin recognition complex subunit 3 N-terminus-domain-containing protein [Chlamydoabsidia padenii]|nr:origin recognition complex subunit 3 N-terminus-domain-containing protein [Chlamydoabsidia padenii]